MGGRLGGRRLDISYLSYVESFGWEEVWRVHDVCLCFQVDGLYAKMVELGSKVNEHSKDISFLEVDTAKGLHLAVFLHRTGIVTCYVRCTRHPVEVTPEGLVGLTAVLAKVASILEDAADSSSFLYKESVVPSVSSWVVMQWHFGRDGKKEIDGKSWHVTYENWSGALIRVYLKKTGDKHKARKEVLEKPRKTLPAAFAEKMVLDDSTGLKDMMRIL
jgi:hypothetical protein